MYTPRNVVGRWLRAFAIGGRITYAPEIPSAAVRACAAVLLLCLAAHGAVAQHNTKLRVGLSLTEVRVEGESEWDFTSFIYSVWEDDSALGRWHLTLDSDYGETDNDRLEMKARHIFNVSEDQGWKPVVFFSTDGEHEFGQVRCATDSLSYPPSVTAASCIHSAPISITNSWTASG